MQNAGLPSASGQQNAQTSPLAHRDGGAPSVLTAIPETKNTPIPSCAIASAAAFRAEMRTET